MQPDVSDQRGHFWVILKAWIFLRGHDFGFGWDSSGCGCVPSDYVSHVGERVLAGIHLQLLSLSASRAIKKKKKKAKGNWNII